MKKNLLPLVAFLLAVGAAPTSAQDQPNATKSFLSSIGLQAPDAHFAEAIEDLPLMENMEVVPEKNVVFIFGSGRLAQTVVKGPVDIDAVYYFYQETLPQLGWAEVSPRLYERGAEQLHVEASSANADGMTYVRFEVKPIKK